MKPRFPARALAAAALVAAIVTMPAPPAEAAVHVRIEGNGSSWAANAVNQWVADVTQQGLQVVFTSTGSAQGRKDYARQTNDFAVTDIPFRGSDPLTGTTDTNEGRPFAYIPIVAGGTAFPYQVRVGGKLVRNIRLSGETLAKIFTNQITNWNDAQITRDNNNRQLPSLAIIPVVHSEGSGSTAQFTRFLAKQYPDMWKSFTKKSQALETEYFPAAKPMVAANGSDQVMNTVTAASSNGAIGYDEYSYALNAGYPAIKVKNANGYFTLPSDYNVAVSLTQAVINTNPNDLDYLIQNLDKVYTYNDARTYPLSSYSYMILPIGRSGDDAHPERRMNTAKRQTLADFLTYSICAGQHSMGALGYSPLPVNLVTAGFDQIKKFSAADSGVVVTAQPIDTCNNPTFVAGQPNTNRLAQIAPMPQACDKDGAGPCADGTTAGGNGSGSGSGNGTGNGSGPNGGTNGSAAPGAGSSASAGPGSVIDPDTGEVIGGNGGGDDNAVATPTDLAAFRGSRYLRVLGPISAALVLAILFIPAIVSRRMSRRREEP